MLERIASLKKHHLKVLQELIMDVLRALASPNLDIRRKTLDIATELISPSNIAEVMLVLKKELSGVQSSSSSTESSDAEYRIMLIKSSFLALMQAVGPLPITVTVPASPGAEEDAP